MARLQVCEVRLYTYEQWQVTLWHMQVLGRQGRGSAEILTVV
jgi:hypothetical protein